MVGSGFTVIAWVAVLLQPRLVPVTVYVVVVVPLKVIGVPVVALRPVPGVQLYVVPPDADKVVVLPIHTAADPDVAVTVGIGFTVTVAVVVALQPVVVPVTE